MQDPNALSEIFKRLDDEEQAKVKSSLNTINRLLQEAVSELEKLNRLVNPKHRRRARVSK